MPRRLSGTIANQITETKASFPEIQGKASLFCFILGGKSLCAAYRNTLEALYLMTES